MKTAKLLFYALVIFLAAVGAFMLFGLLVSAAQYLVWLAVILLAGFVAVKLLKRKRRHAEKPQELPVSGPERELQEALRRIEEINRAQLPQSKNAR